MATAACSSRLWRSAHSSEHDDGRLYAGCYILDCAPVLFLSAVSPTIIMISTPTPHIPSTIFPLSFANHTSRSAQTVCAALSTPTTTLTTTANRRAPHRHHLGVKPTDMTTTLPPRSPPPSVLQTRRNTEEPNHPTPRPATKPRTYPAVCIHRPPITLPPSGHQLNSTFQ